MGMLLIVKDLQSIVKVTVTYWKRSYFMKVQSSTTCDLQDTIQNTGAYCGLEQGAVHFPKMS